MVVPTATENDGLSLASDTDAYAGHLGKARQLTKRSVDSAIRADSKETGAIWQENTALREAAFGNVTDAKQAAAEGLKLVPASQGVEVEAALAFAMAGDTARAESLAQDLNKRFPLDTQMQSLFLQVCTQTRICGPLIIEQGLVQRAVLPDVLALSCVLVALQQLACAECANMFGMFDEILPRFNPMHIDIFVRIHPIGQAWHDIGPDPDLLQGGDIG